MICSTFYQVFQIIYTWILEALREILTPNRFRVKDVSKDIVLITGGGGGFGRLLAMKFAKLGSTIVIWDINESMLIETKSIVERLGGKCYTYICDVSDRNDVYAKAEQVKKDVGNVTILVNNAGVLYSGNLLNLRDENIEKTFKVNVLSHYWTCKAFLPSMLNANSGHIVSIASIAGLAGINKASGYSGSKAAAISLMESLYLEVQFTGKTNIIFTTICPSLMNTSMISGAKGSCAVPTLDPEFVADETMKTILTNKNFVIIPKSLCFGNKLKPFMPAKVIAALMKMLDAENALDGLPN